MRKSGIETRRVNGDILPALNVKYYGRLPMDQLAKRFNVDADSPDLARAAQYAYESACEQFWEQALDALNFAMLGDDAASKLKPCGLEKGPFEIYSDGRSGGWLVVEGLPPVESWDAVRVGRWSKFAKNIAADIAYRTSAEALREDIEANEWIKPYASRYNFIDNGGTVECLADMRARAIAAGFGPVVNKGGA